MLRVTTLYGSSAAATAAYYTRYLAEAPGEVPGVWTGTQAGGLGLSGEVSAEQLEALLEGRDPISGTPLGNLLKDRKLADRRLVRAVAGFDATFSAPKSVSLWWALTGDRRVLEAHDVAVAAALDYLERFGSTTRIRSNGRRLHPDSQGLTIATFRQTTSRADDPQIHTHGVISGKVQTLDGRWLALDARFLKRHQRKLGGLYQSVLRNELTHRFGVDWQPIVNGQAEIAGFPAELIEVFSKRTAEVEQAVKAKVDEFRRRQAREPTPWERAALTREAAADTRGRKTGTGAADLRSEWIAEATRQGWSAADLVEQITTASRDRTATTVQHVTVEEIVEALTTRGSTWSRVDVLQAICDAQRPIGQLDGQRWAAALDRACDRVLDHCIDLDPDPGPGPRRGSDGRSVWLDPSAPHVTSARVLAEEEHVLSWAIDAHASDPSPSPTVTSEGLDVLQADVAAAVAGHDRLVLAVGPAGTGKTTALRAAVDDLARQGRFVFGVSPTAKAARVLEHGTGMQCETVAKLLHEWHRGDRPPLEQFRLPAGSTVIVDEAGMLGTGALHGLVTLTETQQWRLALIGDHRQLQAVGRGGLFHELCTTGRCHELELIHRFHQSWEAAASLQLRHGDPQALDAYESHDRILPGTIDDHLAHLSDAWLRATASGNMAAITTSTNEHVDLINAAIQHARQDAGQLGRFSVAIGGGERAHAGDIVATRRNDRRLITTAGDPVRNRELWTVTAVHGDGSLTVSPQQGHGHVTLPAGYASEHVRLGYAATEHGNQAGTVTIAAHLVTPTTTCRGLYVGVTRGRQQNMLLVVTEQHNLTDARDILERVLATDRSDIPATTVRRQLAADTRPPSERRPSTRQVRCQTPHWWHELRAETEAAIADVEQRLLDESTSRTQLADARQQATSRLSAAKRDHQPHADEINRAEQQVVLAEHRRAHAHRQLAHARLGERRTTRRLLEAAEKHHDAAVRIRDAARQVAEPTRQRLARAHSDVLGAEDAIRTAELLDEWNRISSQLAVDPRRLLTAIDHWRRWADGRDTPPAQLQAMLQVLKSSGSADCHALADSIRQWAHQHRVELPPALPTVDHSPGIEMPGIEL